MDNLFPIALLTAFVLLGAFLIFQANTTQIVVPPFHVALLFKNGAPPKILKTGVYRFFSKNVQHTLFDPRETWAQIAGQELLTSDGAPVRISVSLFRSVSDLPTAAAAPYPDNSLYNLVHLALRDQIVVRTLDALLQEREAVAAAILQEVQPEAQKLGLKIETLSVRDITLVGDTKRAYSEVVQAQLQAKAALERARGEAAAMRSLLNTAQLVRENPELLQLRALQQFASQGNHQIDLNLALGKKQD